MTYDVVYGWKKTLPNLGSDVVSIFARNDSDELIALEKITSVDGKLDAEKLKSICASVKKFLTNVGAENATVAFVDADPLDMLSEVEFILSDIDEYNTVDMMHGVYIETFGNDVKKFSTLLNYSPDYIVVKIVVPESETSDHKPVENAIECLRRSIGHARTDDCEKTLVVIINDKSDISVLKKYFEVISKAFGEDDRVEWAEGAALYSFNIVLSPQTKDLKKILQAQKMLQDPDLNLSQQIQVDTSRIKQDRRTNADSK